LVKLVGTWKLKEHGCTGKRILVGEDDDGREALGALVRVEVLTGTEFVVG
jgi:hypothetical protein